MPWHINDNGVADYWVNTTCNNPAHPALGKIIQWHKDEVVRLRAMNEKRPDPRVLSKARFHSEALKVIDMLSKGQQV